MARDAIAVFRKVLNKRGGDKCQKQRDQQIRRDPAKSMRIPVGPYDCPVWSPIHSPGPHPKEQESENRPREPPEQCVSDLCCATEIPNNKTESGMNGGQDIE